MIYDPKFLPDPSSFERLVHLVIEQEHPAARVHRYLPPDFGIDVLREEQGSFYAYQCKHFPNPRKDILERELRNSLQAAISHRASIPWIHYTLCVSSDLTARQNLSAREVAKDIGLTEEEFDIRSGTSFVGIIMRNQWIWEAVTTYPSVEEVRRSWLTGSQLPLVDSRLRDILEQSQTKGEKQYLSRYLQDAGITRVDAVIDWYELAIEYYRSTTTAMRMMAFESEIASFWLTNRGGKYLRLNRELVDRQVSVYRIYVFDFGMSIENPLAYKTFLEYIIQQENQGIQCTVMDKDMFSETVLTRCSIFGVQDQNNIAVFSNDGYTVTIVHDNDLVKDSIEFYDSLFHHKNCHSASSLLALCH